MKGNKLKWKIISLYQIIIQLQPVWRVLRTFFVRFNLNKMNINNPILNNVINMAQNGNTKGVETFARNICKQRGLDFDTEFNKFKNIL